MESPVLVQRDAPRGFELPNVRQILITSTRKVAEALGTGRRESVYQCALKHELQANLQKTVMLEYPIPILYENERVGVSYLDLLVADDLFVEVKALAKFGGKDALQTSAYARDTGLVGALVNFKQVPAGGIEIEFYNWAGKAPLRPEAGH